MLTAQEHLWPEPPLFTQSGMLLYYYRVTQLLVGFGNPDWASQLGVVCLPTFGPEWALKVVENESEDPSIMLALARERIAWNLKKDVSVERFEAPLPRAVAAEAHQVWEAMLRQTRHRNEPPDFHAYDGEHFHFLCKNSAGLLAGCAIEFGEEAPPGRLIALARSLAEFARSTESRRAQALLEVKDRLRSFSNMAT